MQPYKSHVPTCFDSHITLDGREDWLVLRCSRTRDSGPLDESNFAMALERLGGEENPAVEVHRFGHWACGWYEIIIVEPGTNAACEAEKIVRHIEGCSILDEDDFSERENEAADLTWKDCYSVSERIRYIRKHRSQFEFRSFSDMLSCVRGKYFAGYASELIS